MLQLENYLVICVSKTEARFDRLLKNEHEIFCIFIEVCFLLLPDLRL